MSTKLDWSSLESPEGLKTESSSQSVSKNGLDWSSLESLQEYDVRKPPLEAESTGKSITRTALQPAIGALSMTTPALVASGWQLLGTGEALDELSQWKDGREEELRKKFPTAPWPKEPVFDEKKYMEALQTASKTIPTVENLSSFIEGQTGLPLEAKTMLQRKLRLAGQAAKLRPGDIVDKVLAGTTAGLASGGLESMGAPEPVADIAGLSMPGLAKQIIPNAAQKDLVDFARKMGLNEKQIVPAIQSASKQRLFAGIAEKGTTTQKTLAESKEAIGNIFENLRNSSEASGRLTVEDANQFANEVAAIAKQLPAEMRQRVFADALELAQTGFSGEGIINFWQDLNYYIPRGEVGLGRFKGPLERALIKISPELGENFVQANKLYANIATLKKYMNPTLADKIIKGGKFYQFISSMLTGNLKALTKTLTTLTGISAAQRLAKNMLINPRYQNLFRQMIRSISTNKLGIASKLKDKLTDKLSNDNPETAEELKKANL